MGTNKDTRDWFEIMNKQDVETAIQKSTGEMYKPELKIENIFDYKKELVDQKIQVVSEEGHVLRVLSGSIENMKATKKTLVSLIFQSL